MPVPMHHACAHVSHVSCLRPCVTPAPMQTLEGVVTASIVLLVFFTTTAETSIGNWIYT